ncbi:MAG TPA: GNAT family N-acetyltransferase [Frateuria sp.]|uniref:GNAT family N-acetyltransferase n=1 Tax=Frateuria sp. TaxID=2211372 RepID=UPI002D80FFAB|nr:GNAT family N-acetyltransferase [Frateuria sp.]HET6804176.1 GNAT family N-acetyltransferase [Frateuria sp.]
MIDIRPAAFPHDLPVVRTLFEEYAAGLGVDLGFQGFDAELAALPGKYQPPGGQLLLAWRGAEPVGCVALRRMDAHACEMKRLYVRPAARGLDLGRQLVERLCTLAAQAGYRCIRLDTLPDMHAAQRLYRALGFVPIAPYVFNPVPGTQYMERPLPAAP